LFRTNITQHSSPTLTNKHWMKVLIIGYSEHGELTNRK